MSFPHVELSLESDTFYILLRESKIDHSFELTPDIIIDLDSDNGVVGIDIQNMTKVLQEHGRSALASMQADKKLQLVPA